ncbi:MAG: DNA adenine methylase [Rhodocyclales bacterium]|nr:DNA adenine methylase [Rhodocyclales bacterium]
MKTASPLRYPGGKSAMSSLLRQIRKVNGLGSFEIAEPFAGGAGASLSLLFQEDTPTVHLNDADLAIHDFWWTLVNRAEPFLEMLDTANVDIEEWLYQREIYRRRGKVSRLRRGFSAFFLNRCNRSGIIMNGGPIGGVEQQGKWKIDARFNKPELHRRCKKVSEYRDRIAISGIDGISFIGMLDPASVLFFIDPPYFVKGSLLYLNLLDAGYHATLASKLKGMTEAAWVVTYDDCPEIRDLYQGWANIRPFALRYAAAERRSGKEILITPKWMALPNEQDSLAIAW